MIRYRIHMDQILWNSLLNIGGLSKISAFSISTIDSVFENLYFCDVFVRIKVHTFMKTDLFPPDSIQKGSNVNGTLKSVDNSTTTWEMKKFNENLLSSRGFICIIKISLQVTLKRTYVWEDALPWLLVPLVRRGTWYFCRGLTTSFRCTTLLLLVTLALSWHTVM